MENYEVLEVEKYKERLHIALKAARICVFEVDLQNQLYTFFENAEDIFGVSGQSILQDVQSFSQMSPTEYQRNVSEYFSHPDDKDVISRAFQCILKGKPTTYQARMKAGGSKFIWCKLDVTPIIENNVPVKMIGVITDISDIKTKTDHLENAAKLDNFTGLFNKSSSVDLIQKKLCRNTEQHHALILLDIDNFKSINDTFGHYTGDNIIKLVSDTLKNNFRKTDIIGRFGGDEFILLIQNIPNLDWLTQKLHKLVRCGAHGLSCTNSIGVSLFPEDGTEFELLFKKADHALYQSKSFKEKYTIYSGCEA